MTTALVVAWLRDAAAVVHEQRTWLTDLDAAIGDGDHGINLDRGFGLVAGRLADGALRATSPGQVLADAGRSIMGAVGGASGALYGRALMRAGQLMESNGAARDGTPSAGADLVLDALGTAADAIAALGRSTVGEKTMLDAIVPAVAAGRRARMSGLDLVQVLTAAAAAAEAGARQTIPMLATKGRASYLGERSIGHQDPGAASSALLIAALAAAAQADGT